jgi:glutathione peroxidase
LKLFLPIFIIFLSITLIALSGCTQKSAENISPTNTPISSFYGLSAESIDGKIISMNDYKGMYVLVVNTASKCGYTYQYEQLEKLSQNYKDRLIVLGFPSNDFLWQEPASNEKIKSFCSLKFGVTFPMFAKIEVKGKNKHPIYEWLTNPELNGWNTTKPGWNFNKYLIDKNGKLIAHFDAKTDPLSEKITSLLK